MLTGAALLIIISYALLILQMFNYFNISFLVLYFYGQECTIIQKVSSCFREETKHETGQTYLFERVQYFEETIRYALSSRGHECLARIIFMAGNRSELVSRLMNYIS